MEGSPPFVKYVKKNIHKKNIKKVFQTKIKIKIFHTKCNQNPVKNENLKILGVGWETPFIFNKPSATEKLDPYFVEEYSFKVVISEKGANRDHSYIAFFNHSEYLPIS